MDTAGSTPWVKNVRSHDLDVATENPAPMADIADRLRRKLTEQDRRVTVIGGNPLSARLLTADPDSGEGARWTSSRKTSGPHHSPPSTVPYSPSTTSIGTEVRALAGAEWYDDEEFASYGLTEDQIAELRTWAQQRMSNPDQRLGENEILHDTWRRPT